MNDKNMISCIIPAFNEQTTVGEIARIALSISLLDEIIVVNDHSNDHTAEVARKIGAIVIDNTGERGKAQAMEYGVAQANGDVILFLDADLVGLTPTHIESLIQPVFSGRSDMTIAIRDRGSIIASLNKRLGPWIAGERCLKRSLWEGLPNEYKKGFQIELALNHYAAQQRLRVAPILLNGLSIRRKEQKYGVLRGLWMRVKMIGELIIVFTKLHLAN